MASGLYNRGKLKLVDGSHVWGTTAVGVLLVTSNYVPDPDHNFVSDVSADELAGGNYSRGVLAGQTGPTEDDTNDRVNYDADDQVFSALEAAAGTPQFAVFYDDTNGTDATRDLLGFVDLGAPAAPNGSDYTIQWGAPMFYLG